MMKIIFVVGPTASGKSQLALHLAQKFNGSIVNIDSVQFYEGLVIGSAAPSEGDKQKAPHYLFSYVKAPLEMTAGQYIRDFYELIQTQQIKSPVFVVGGTGFYIQALEKGMFDLPEVPLEIKNQIIEELDANGCRTLFQELKTFDPDTTLHENDHYRICRALEVKRAFNKKMSEFKNLEIENKNKLPFPSMKLGLTFSSDDKEKYVARVRQRTSQMLKDGLIAETKHFMDCGFTDWLPLASVGYQETKQYLKSEITLEQLPEMITQATMKLVKKQKTWFKRDETILWSDVFNLDISVCEKQVQDFLV